MKKDLKIRLAGGGAGLINGIFGGGGGMLLLPLLPLSERERYASSVAIILPLCCVSAAVYFFRSELSFAVAAPYLAGGAVGGLIGGIFYKKVPTRLLRFLFAGFLLYGGVRYLL